MATSKLGVQQLHCACGAIRETPLSLSISILSCVRCGRAMVPVTSNPFTPAPPLSRVATATLATQLLGALTFALALYWIIALRTTTAPILATLGVGASVVFAGGSSLRGSIPGLAISAIANLCIAILTLARWPTAETLLAAPATRADLPASAVPLAMVAIGTFAALAAFACFAALPQARRFAAWRVTQILHAAQTRDALH